MRKLQRARAGARETRPMHPTGAYPAQSNGASVTFCYGKSTNIKTCFDISERKINDNLKFYNRSNYFIGHKFPTTMRSDVDHAATVRRRRRRRKEKKREKTKLKRPSRTRVDTLKE